MIPKIIHYCWFGGAELPEKDKECIESWKKFCPDYKIVRWDETNYDLTKNKYMHEAYTNKKWGFVPDYARFDIVYTHGGIYLDTDVEIVRNLDFLLDNDGYLGFEEGSFVNGGIGFGAEQGNVVMKGLRDMYDSIEFLKPNGSINALPSPYYITEFLEKIGLVRNNEKQLVNGITVYPTDYFSPKEFSTGKLVITDNTCTIHHYNASWFNDKEKRQLTRTRKINKMFGKKLGGVFNLILNKAGRVWEKVCRGIK